MPEDSSGKLLEDLIANKSKKSVILFKDEILIQE